MKKLLFCLLVLAGFTVNAQVYNNEWIDYSKTYYKFKVGKTGLHRIGQATLAAAGFGSTPAEHFQLWRNGVEVPIYTSIQSGTFSTTDYIEFWGEMNDGKPDNQLYRRPEYQLNDKWSLQTDTASYFLTINPSANNRRLTPTNNNVSGNTLPAEPYFMHTVGNYFKNRRNAGRGVPVGEIMYSSSYDYGEGWSSGDIAMNAALTTPFTALFAATSGPNPKIKLAVSGNANNCRRYRLTVNADSIYGKDVNFYNYSVDSTIFPLSTLNKLGNNAASVVLTNVQVCCDSVCHTSDRMVIHQYELTYPRQFNFGGATNFEFSLPASAMGQYLEITGFTHGSIPPVLYDLSNGKRYVVDISTPARLKIVLEPSAVDRKLVLAGQQAANKTDISSLQARNFTDYRQVQNQADYIIISNPLLFSAPDGSDPVEQYREYRGSVNGGSYNAKTFLIEDLVDQFAFGIKKHPLAVRNFLHFARNQFSVAPKQVFLIGKGVNYSDYRGSESNANAEKLNLVPTFGWPASDVLLSADPGDSYPKIPIGRLSVVNGQEVAIYLKKVKEFESAQKLSSPSISEKAWMKNVVHVVGASEAGLQTILDNNMVKYKGIISDTLFGAKVTTFTKTSPDAVQQINSGLLNKLFEEGITLMTYFGHSSATSLEFNLNNPEQYNNTGKYPLFVALGCNVGDFYKFNTVRLVAKETLSEKFVLEQDKGTIGFIASTHYGIVHYLDIFNERFYKAISSTDYGKTIGELVQSGIAQTFAFTTQEDFYARASCEETSLNGDPAVRLNPHAKPDYAIEDNLLRVSPSFVSVADNAFDINAKFINIGKAINQAIVIEVKREYPDQSVKVIYRDTIPGIKYADSISLSIPIDPLKDKGLNKITVTIDADNNVDELHETNNSISKEITIYEDELRPIYPFDFSIVNKQNIKLLASTANPFSSFKEYRMEIDTTALFDTPLASRSKTSVGGVIEFDPGIEFKDNTVYYWRVAQIPTTGSPAWNTFSFVYLKDHEIGFNQSHLYQHFHSQNQHISFDSTGKWRYDSILNNLNIRNAMIGFASQQEADVSIAVNGIRYIRNDCGHSSIVFNVFDPNSFKPSINSNGAYGSAALCSPSRQWNYEYNLKTAASRKLAMDFMDSIPDGSYVVVRSMLWSKPAGVYVDEWKKDEALFGTGNTLYHKLKSAGFATVDSFNRPRVFAFVYQKGNNGFTPVYDMSENENDILVMSVDLRTPDSVGYMVSPKFGPAKAWKEMLWSGTSVEAVSTDNPTVDILGIRLDGTSSVLNGGIDKSQSRIDISNINAEEFPYLQLRMRNADSINFSPYQLKYWRLTYDAIPEGAVAPNLFFSMKDTLDAGEPLDFKIAFKDISDAAFDSLKVKMVVTDRNNVSHVMPIQKQKPLASQDTLHIHYPIDTRQLQGENSLYVEVNPDNDQPEQYHFNNFIVKNFYVRGDTLNPMLDVTFDNMHILNGDIVAAKPDIQIKLKDESKWMLLSDTSLVTVKVLYPDGGLRTFNFNSDTLLFMPPQPGQNSDNTATISFKPFFEMDGDYQLIITGKDNSGNVTGSVEYKIGFQVINKPMISNMLNYPNPFTTSTAFVFTITGAEVPQNLRIQILSVTGRVVREITKEELGPLRVGRNITEYKWDGTDQYGQRLANGVYLYRVITNLNGKALDKYSTESSDTDKYFKKGYGKMYLMR